MIKTPVYASTDGLDDIKEQLNDDAKGRVSEKS